MTSKNYYNHYWQKRGLKSSKPISPLIPGFLRRYSYYGAVLNLIPEKSRILDLGCGNGNVSRLYLKKGKVTGLDISKIALKKASGFGIKTKLYDLDKLPLPFKNKAFEVVILTDVLEHLLNPLAILKEISRLLTNKGQLIISVPNFARLENRLQMLWGDPTDILHFDKYGDFKEHLHWFTIPKIKYFLNLAGFEEISFIPVGLPFGFIFTILGFPSLSKMLTIKAGKK